MTILLCARRIAAAAAAAAIWGCATMETPFDGHLGSKSAPVRECAEWFRVLDAQVDAAGVRDAQDARVQGFPYLRASRLLAALRPRAESSESALQALTERMRELDIEARRYEIMNLPAGPPEALERTQRCGRLLRDADLADAASRRALLERATVPDDYQDVDRVFGLYAIAQIPFAAGLRRFEAETRATFEREPQLPADASLVRYVPPPGPLPPRAETARVLALAADNPLGIPLLDDAELRQLLAAYAPSFEVAVRADYDRVGALRWSRESAMPEVELARPVAYAHAAGTLYRGRVLLQLVYTFWFPERPAQVQGGIL